MDKKVRIPLDAKQLLLKGAKLKIQDGSKNHSSWRISISSLTLFFFSLSSLNSSILKLEELSFVPLLDSSHSCAILVPPIFYYLCLKKICLYIIFNIFNN